ncbi:hypothetical protein D3C84_1305900 [compost metagenome]
MLPVMLYCPVVGADATFVTAVPLSRVSFKKKIAGVVPLTGVAERVAEVPVIVIISRFITF